MIRIVLDANVLVSAILSPRGTPAQILHAWRDEQFDLVISDAILAEIGRVLRYPKIATRHRWSEEQLRAFLDDLAHVAMRTPGILTLAVITEDPPDDRYLECAVEGEASYIVSGDQFLLRLGAYQGIPILTPRAFLEVLQRQTKPSTE
jgi:putative PIN family toxin of toxin-antitoxin system